MNLLRSTAPIEQHSLQPGSRAWLEHRYNCNNASDAPAMLGCDDQRSRNDLIHAMHVGFSPEVGSFKQGIYDAGHRYEALARPLGEAVMGEELYPLVLSRSWREHRILRPLGGSMDGSTIARQANWEHKQLNKALAEALPYVGPEGVHLNDAGALALKFRVQMEQQMMVNDAQRCLFTASAWNDRDELIEARHCWYYPDPDLRAQIVAGWVQFEADLAAYTPVEVIDAPTIVARTPEQLPAIRSEVRGTLVLDSNIKEWEEAALAYIADVKERINKAETDQDFADADAAEVWCGTTKTTLLGMRAHLMGATGDVNTAVGMLDRIIKELDGTKTAISKGKAARRETRKTEMGEATRKKLAEYIATLDADLATLMPAATVLKLPDVTHEKIQFSTGKCFLNKRSYKNMQDALDQELARAKIAAGALRDLFRANYLLLQDEGKGHGTLFPDWRDLLYTATELLRPLVRQRIADHQTEQERIRLAAEQKQREEEAAAQAREEEAQRQREQQAAAPAPTPAPAQVAAPAADSGAIVGAAPTGTIHGGSIRPPVFQGGGGYGTAAISAVAPASRPNWSNSEPVNVGPEDGARPAAPANEIHTGPVDMKLNEIVAVTGVGLTEERLAELGFPCAKRDRQSRLYHRGALPAILDALIRDHARVRNSLHLADEKKAA